MPQRDFQAIVERIRTRYNGCAPETFMRINLFIAKLTEMRNNHSCIVNLDPTQAQLLQHRAVLADVKDGYANIHTNILGDTFYKYIK